jgi:NAD(P)H-quinone oxidoreductase subunit 5
MTLSIPLPLIAPALLLAVSLLSLAQSGRRPGAFPRIAEAAAGAAVLLSLAGVAQLLIAGPVEFSAGAGLALIVFNLDAVSATMALLVSFVGWVVQRYSVTYLDGEAREGAFHGLLLATLASVLILVQAASLPVFVLGFIAVGETLRRLLLFYADRPEAVRAAAKFRKVWRAGDLALVCAATGFSVATGTMDIRQINLGASEQAGVLFHVSVACLVLAAALKTAAFPLHGWLTEVMEAPTPVSALLHAGVINAGGFLLIRMSDAVQASPGAMAALVLVGGLSALFGAVVMLTQSAVKTALAWSTVSQMGFMLLQCGLGLWALALLHIVAHSLYKAHAFLSSGTAIRNVVWAKRLGPVAAPGLAAVAKAFALALVLFALVAAGSHFLLGPKSAQSLALGAILIFGVAYLVAQGLADTAPGELTKRTAAAATAAALSYFALQFLAGKLWGQHLAATPQAGSLEWALIVLAVASFGLVAVAQSLFPLWAHHPAAAGLRVHVANGFYLNAIFDRLAGGFRTPTPSK